MTPTLAEFFAWLEQGPYAIPTLPNQADLQPTDLALPIDNKRGDRFTIEFFQNQGTIQTVTGGDVAFDVSEAGQTWYRFFGLLQTSARNIGFHGVGLPQPLAHRMPGSYNSPSQPPGPANLHGWFNCPNNRACPFVAASIRAFLLNTLPEYHPLYQWV
jgi:hypothetical protein